jgi:hypothetical protein
VSVPAATADVPAPDDPGGGPDDTGAVADGPEPSDPLPTAPAPVGEPVEPACPDAVLPPRVIEEIGWEDVDGDDAPELWVRTGSGASTILVGLVRYDADCRPTRVTLGGQPAELPVGGSVSNAAGLECGASDPDAHLTAYSATSRDGISYEVTARELRLDGNELLEVGTRARTIDADDPDFGRYTSFHCRSLAL